MPHYKVDLCPDAKPQALYREIQAETAQKAAEKAYGRQLTDKGTINKLRAQVRSSRFPGSTKCFYEV